MTRHKLLTLASYLIPLASVLLFPSQTIAQTHPFLLTTQSQFSTLQARSSQPPYSTMKTDAINTCQNLQYTSKDNACVGTGYNDTHCMRNLMSACALAYIVDPTNKLTYLNKVTSILPRWEDILIIQSGAAPGTNRNTTNEYYNIAGAAYFNTLLALDIMHQDLLTRPGPSATGYPRSFSSQLDYAQFLMEQEYNHFYGITNPVYDFYLKDGTSTKAYHMPSRHPPAQEAILIIWKIYTGSFNPTDSDSRALFFGGMLNNGYPDLDGDGKNIGGYLPEVSARINSSGVYTEGPSYAMAGWSSDRDERAYLIDVLEFTGKDTQFGVDFYTNPRWQNFFEWLYGYASTPFGMHVSYGDTYAYRMMTDSVGFGAIIAKSPRINSAGKFSAAAGAYAQWKSYGLAPEGRLLSYILLEPDIAAGTPQSRIFENGGAFFLSQPVTNQSLYGSLWNVREPEEGSPVFHVRKDVNALYLSAYGAPLLMNGGFCGSNSPSGPDACLGQYHDSSGNLVNYPNRFSGQYLGDRAVSNNVALVNYDHVWSTDQFGHVVPSQDNHPTKFGSGVIEGFIGLGLDYASASTRYQSQSTVKNFLPNGVHHRNFLLIHPTQNNRGYFVSFDEFSEVSQGPVHLVFHPNARTRTTISNLTEYETTLARQVQADSTTRFNLFFATPPSNIEFTRGIIATASNIGAYVPEYFFNSYSVGTNGRKHITTILFPHNSANTKPPLTRISGTAFTGARIDHTAFLQDFALESTGLTDISHSGITLRAKAAFYRLQSNNLTHYFIRQGRSLTNGASPSTGFSSTQDISLYLNGTQGNIVSPGTSVTFRYPGLTGLRLNGQTISGSTGSNTFTATIPQGTHTLELITNNTPTPTAPASTPTPTPTPINYSLDNDTDIDIFDILILISRFTQALVGDFNQNGRIDIFDFNTLLKNRL
jgi:hypothetical protein